MLTDIFKNLAALIKVKTIITLVVLMIFAVQSLKGEVSSETTMTIVTTVIAFYFGTQSEKNSK